MIYLGKNAVGISDTALVVDKETVNRINAVEIKETVSTPSSIMTITDGADKVPVDELIVGIEPLQDLHGYDSPWPAGGGKNLFDWQDTSKIYEMWPGNDVLNMQTNTRSLALPCEPNTSYTISKSVTNVVFVGCWIKEAPAQGVAVYGRVQVTTNSPITITTGEDATYLVCWYYNNAQGNETLTPEQIAQTIQIETGSTATAYAPYENICPISGWNGTSIHRPHKNFIGEFQVGYGINASTGEILVMPHHKQAVCKIPLRFIGNEEYRLSNTTINNCTLFAFDANGGYIGRTPGTQDAKNRIFSKNSFFLSLTGNTNPIYYIVIHVGNNDNEAEVEAVNDYQWQIKLASEPTDYIPNYGENVSVSWQSEVGTVYGGELNVTTGELVVEWTKYRMPTLTSSNVKIAYDTYIKSDACDFFIYPNIAPYPSTSPAAQTYTPLCNQLIFANKDIWINTGYKNTFTINANQIHINISNELLGITDYTQETRSTVITKIIEYFNNLYNSENYFEFVYKIAPQTYQLTPAQITTLLGTNHIWADTGDILSLTYSADPKMYVDQNKGVADVQVNGTSIVADGVANVPYLGNDVNSQVETWGIPYIKNGNLFGFRTVDIAGKMCFALNSASASGIKNLVNQNVSGYGIIDSNNVDKAAFFGLALAAGANMAYAPNTVGTYTETAKSKISDMLSAPVPVSGTTSSITAMPGVRYICGEVSTLSITVPESGIIDVTFTSGSTPTALTIIPPTGKTMKWMNEFDPTTLEADTTYEINIMDGCYGVVGSWT